MLDFSPQCCDAMEYLQLGQRCAADLRGCWDALRPMGASLYFSVPFRLGLPVAPTIIAMNFTLMALSIGLAVRALPIRPLIGWPIALASHLAFMYGPALNSLSDVPAASVTLIALWWLILGDRTDRVWMRVAAGAALGLAVTLRSFYLYPALLTALASVGYILCCKRAVAAVFPLTLVLPILCQYGATHSQTGTWSFIDHRLTASIEEMELRRSFWGYDTLLIGDNSAQELPYTGCAPGGLREVMRTGDVTGAACLVGKRLYFYFASYTPGNKVYLTSAAERVFSPWIALTHAVWLAFAAYAALKAPRTTSLILPCVLVAFILLQGLIVHPESRYLICPYVFLWTLGVGTGPIARRAARAVPVWRCVESAS
jgi:hypothetical protein